MHAWRWITARCETEKKKGHPDPRSALAKNARRWMLTSQVRVCARHGSSKSDVILKFSENGLRHLVKEWNAWFGWREFKSWGEGWLHLYLHVMGYQPRLPGGRPHKLPALVNSIKTQQQSKEVYRAYHTNTHAQHESCRMSHKGLPIYSNIYKRWREFSKKLHFGIGEHCRQSLWERTRTSLNGAQEQCKTAWWRTSAESGRLKYIDGSGARICISKLNIRLQIGIS